MEDKNSKKLILAFSRKTEIQFGRINNCYYFFFNPLIFRKIHVYIHDAKRSIYAYIWRMNIHLQNDRSRE